MRQRKKLIAYSIIIFVTAVIVYAWPRVPIITAFAAKGMSSGVFVAHRTPDQVKKTDLNFFPINLARVKIDRSRHTATASILGLAKRTAVYRNGLGCAVSTDFTPEKIREQEITSIPEPPFNPDTVMWPLGNIVPDIIPSGINKTLMDSIMTAAVDPPQSEPFKKTFAAVVVYRDTIIGEVYAEGISPETPLLGWSMSKSITNALTAILVKENKLVISQKAPVEEWSNDERSNITLLHLLHMTSGLSWDENYFNVSDATKMLYVYGDMYGYAVKSDVSYLPDSVWYYSSGTSNILSGIIRKTVNNDDEYHTFPLQKLFYRTGMLHTTLEADASGTFVGSSYTYAPARDWARFGLLFLHNGIMAGDTILPPGWVDFTRTPAPHSDGTYGAQFWLNGSGTLKDVPEDMFYCDGFMGQRVFIIPSKELVVVRLGWSYEHFDFNAFVRDILRALPE